MSVANLSQETEKPITKFPKGDLEYKLPYLVSVLTNNTGKNSNEVIHFSIVDVKIPKV